MRARPTTSTSLAWCWRQRWGRSSATTSDLVGHWGGYRLLVRYGPYIRLSEKRIKIARYLFLRYGGEVVFFGRFTAILRAYAAFLAGTTRMPWRRFLFFNAAGGVVWATVYGGGAYLVGKQIDRLSGPLGVVFVVGAAGAIVAGAVIVRRQEDRLAAAAERAFPGPLKI